MAVCSDGSYGVPEGLDLGLPVPTKNGAWSIVQGLDLDEFSRGRIDASVGELGEERDAVSELGPDLAGAAVKLWRQASPFGDVTVVVTEHGVREISLPGDDQPDGEPGAPDRAVARAARRVVRRQAARRSTLTLDLEGIDGFRRTVLETLARDVRGARSSPTESSPAWRAARERHGRSGSAMRDNPLPFVIPCHRVVAAGGRIGGYGGGRNAVALKRELLAREGVTGLRFSNRRQYAAYDGPVTPVRGRVSGGRRAWRPRRRSRCPCRRRR